MAAIQPKTTKSAKKAPAKSAKKAPAKSAKKAPAKSAKKAPAKSAKKAPAQLKKPDLAELALRLERAIPIPMHELSFKSPFELLIATILAAQSTDKTVNQVMPLLLARFPSAHELAAAGQDEVETLVKRTGFFRNKARAIRETALQLVTSHGGEVPRTMDELITLSGVARKTANVVLGTAYGIQAGFVVDTHVARLAQRLGLTRYSDPVRIEDDLCRTFARGVWTDLGHRFTLHGRYTCLSKQPLCPDCPINELCPSRQSLAEVPWELRATHEAARVEAGIQASQGIATESSHPYPATRASRDCEVKAKSSRVNALVE